MSSPSLPLPYESSPTKYRPDICIGTDEFHTPEDLCHRCAQLFDERGCSIKINDPFSGSIVPLTHYQKNKEVNSIMIELNRSLFMDESTGEKNSGYNKMKFDLEWIMGRLPVEYPLSLICASVSYIFSFNW